MRKDRLIELMHDFVLFDGGMKKLPRVHQYFGIKAAQEHVNAYKGGIIWHTQGSGKSIVMVLLAKWILETSPTPALCIVTDRDELDKQIERVFADAGEGINRTSSGRDLMAQLGQAKPRLLCSLVHKFGRKGVDDFEAFIKELEKQPCRTVGRVVRFRGRMPPHPERQTPPHDEGAHAQRGVRRLHGHAAAQEGQANQPRNLWQLHPHLQIQRGRGGRAWFSTSSMRRGTSTSGSARRTGLTPGSTPRRRGLNEWQKAALREQWGTMQKVLSSRSRMERVVEDIVFDFGVKPRLSNRAG